MYLGKWGPPTYVSRTKHVYVVYIHYGSFLFLLCYLGKTHKKICVFLVVELLSSECPSPLDISGSHFFRPFFSLIKRVSLLRGSRGLVVRPLKKQLFFMSFFSWSCFKCCCFNAVKEVYCKKEEKF